MLLKLTDYKTGNPVYVNIGRAMGLVRCEKTPDYEERTRVTLEDRFVYLVKETPEEIIKSWKALEKQGGKEEGREERDLELIDELIMALASTTYSTGYSNSSVTYTSAGRFADLEGRWSVVRLAMDRLQSARKAGEMPIITKMLSDYLKTRGS